MAAWGEGGNIEIRAGKCARKSSTVFSISAIRRDLICSFNATTTKSASMTAGSTDRTPARLRRVTELPHFIEGELRLKRSYPHTLSFVSPTGEVQIRYRRSGYRKFEDGEGIVRKRITFCWLEAEGERIGAMEFAEFQLDPMIDNDQFFHEMDIEEHTDMALAEVLCAQWKDVEFSVGRHGPITQFRALWMKPGAGRPGIWIPAADAMLRAHLSRHSILVLKAMPLEFESRRTHDQAPLSHDHLLERRAALVRYYRRVLGVVPFSSVDFDEGWLWKPNPFLGPTVIT
jgi:hypothetical protein